MADPAFFEKGGPNFYEENTEFIFLHNSPNKLRIIPGQVDVKEFIFCSSLRSFCCNMRSYWCQKIGKRAYRRDEKGVVVGEVKI